MFQSTAMTRYFGRPKSLDATLPWLLALLAAGYVTYYWPSPAELEELARVVAKGGDRGSYLNFSEIRTAGYPIFIKAIAAVFGSVDAVPKAQLVITAASFAFLGWSVHRTFGSFFFALAPVLALMLYPRIGDWHIDFMTESLFMSLLCLLTAGLIFVVQRPTWYMAAGAALACGLAITVRPAGMSLLIVWPFLFWLIWRRCGTGRHRIVMVTAVITPIVLCILVENVIWHTNHDSEFRPNLADRHLFGKALIIESEPQISDPELARLVAEGRSVTALGRKLIAEAPSYYARTRLLVDFEVRTHGYIYKHEFATKVKAIAQRRGVGEYDVLAQIGRPAMLKNPVAWMRNALIHYFGLWIRAYVTPTIHEEYLVYLENSEPSPLIRNEIWLRGDPLSRLQRLSAQPMAAALLVSILSVGLAAWHRLRQRGLDSRLVVAAVCALAIHAHLLIVGMLGVTESRYAVAMGPLLAISVGLLASWVIERSSNAVAGCSRAWPRQSGE